MFMLVFYLLVQAITGFHDEYCGRSELPAYIPPENGRIVEKVHVFFRHGMRTDFQKHSCFPNNAQPAYSCSLDTEMGIKSHNSGSGHLIVKKYSSGCEVGQLLDYAQTQMNRLANFLKHNYMKTQDKIFLRSTDKTRTLGSLDLLLSQLADDKDNSVTMNQVHVEEFGEDPLSLNDHRCHKVSFLENAFWSSTAFQRVTVDSPDYEKCSSLWVDEIGTPFDLTQVGDCLVAPQCAHVRLPNNIEPSSELYACVKNLFNGIQELRYNANNENVWSEGKEYCQLATRSIWADLLDVSRSDTRVSLWATHDDVIACMLSSLSLWKRGVAQICVVPNCGRTQ